MKLSDVLLHHATVGDLVMFKDHGRQIGCTLVDSEHLFMGSINPELLTRDVKGYRYKPRYWTIKPVLVVDISQ